ncbi:hypothetical protein [Ureibacillus thermosphaericus]|uniref:hypothetical protein n=1 Tax=Ureibacillus thermosphaericus TaxID=51173 RepID=UPI000BBC880A|nr:hypothetical protein [Ureibacillus thermosphaericus]
MNSNIVMYYSMLIIGALLLLVTVRLLIELFKTKEHKGAMLFLIILVGFMGSLLFFGNLPTLKYVLTKDYEVIKGECVFEMDSSHLGFSFDMKMLDTNEDYFFATDAELAFDEPSKIMDYGIENTFYCEVTVTKDHELKIHHKIYDPDTGKLIISGE